MRASHPVYKGRWLQPMRMPTRTIRQFQSSLGLGAAILSTSCLSPTADGHSAHSVLPQCDLVAVAPPTQTGRLWLAVGDQVGAQYLVRWSQPPQTAAACNISARSRDTTIVSVTGFENPGVSLFTFKPRGIGTTGVAVSLGAYNAPQIGVVVTDSTTYTRAVAHRGAGDLAPENTFSAMLLASTYPVPGVEFDVRLTLDSIPILMHDATTIRTTGYDGTVSRMTFVQIERLNAAAYYGPAAPHEPPPSLLEVLTLLQASAVPLVFAEIKHDSAFSPATEASRVLGVVHSSGIGQRIVVYSTSTAVLDAVRQQDSTVRLGYAPPKYLATQPAFYKNTRVEFGFYPIDSMAPDSVELQALAINVKIVASTASRIPQADSTAHRPYVAFVLADSVPALFDPRPAQVIVPTSGTVSIPRALRPSVRPASQRDGRQSPQENH